MVVLGLALGVLAVVVVRKVEREVEGDELSSTAAELGVDDGTARLWGLSLVFTGPSRPTIAQSARDDRLSLSLVS